MFGYNGGSCPRTSDICKFPPGVTCVMSPRINKIDTEFRNCNGAHRRIPVTSVFVVLDCTPEEKQQYIETVRATRFDDAYAVTCGMVALDEMSARLVEMGGLGG